MVLACTAAVPPTALSWYRGLSTVSRQPLSSTCTSNSSTTMTVTTCVLRLVTRADHNRVMYVCEASYDVTSVVTTSSVRLTVFCKYSSPTATHRVIGGHANAWPFSVFTQIFGPRTAISQPIWIKFCIHLLLYGIHWRADLDRDRRVGGSRPNQNVYVFVILVSCDAL